MRIRPTLRHSRPVQRVAPTNNKPLHWGFLFTRNQMKKLHEFFNPFHKPTAEEVIQKNLEEYARQLVVQEAAAAYHRKLAEFYKEGIVRLRSQVVLNG